MRQRATSFSAIRPNHLRRALRRHDGNVSRAARQLGLQHWAFLKKLRHHHLVDLVQALRLQREERERQRVVDLLVQHQGNVAAVARTLGIRYSSLTPRIIRYGLREFVLALRPQKPTPAEDKARILASIRRHHGQVWRVREELGVSKGTLLSRMRAYDLFAEADALRIEANLTGPRTRLPEGRNRSQRRATLIALLESCNWTVRRAAKIQRVSLGTFYTMMHDLEIDWRKGARQDRLHRLIDALRLGGGVLARTARVLGVEYRTVLHWCEEFDIQPRDYRA